MRRIEEALRWRHLRITVARLADSADEDSVFRFVPTFAVQVYAWPTTGLPRTNAATVIAYDGDLWNNRFAIDDALPVLRCSRLQVCADVQADPLDRVGRDIHFQNSLGR